jgi:1-aminocyclopropane-1-carboxylate deaminase/D-cysteine desulfhydrase-like pyridoxal-dependent ACC family enzyme
MIPLFDRYPRLAESLPRVALCDLPTPVRRLERLGAALHLPHLYVKRDDLTALLFGGNKVRALEFLFGRARERRAKRVVAVGLAGTSMALATTLYAKQLGLACTALLLSATTTEEARRNLRYLRWLDADIHPMKRNPFTLLRILFHCWRLDGTLPTLFNPSSPVGISGYVNAGFELAQQVEQGVLPEPDRIYLALGLQGTAVGLMLGVRATGLKSQVVCVSSHASSNDQHTKARMVKRFRKANAYLRRHDPSFPFVELAAEEIALRSEPAGKGPLFTVGRSQIQPVWEVEHFRLDTTWTAPTYAALLQDVEREQLQDQTILFWQTSNSRPYPLGVEEVDYHALPAGFHAYFTGPVQEINVPAWMYHEDTPRISRS